MRKVNLLVPVPSIRNTLRPDGSYRKTGQGKRLTTVIALLLLMAATGYAAISYLNAPAPDVAVVNVPAPPVVETPAPKPQEPATPQPIAEEPKPAAQVEDQTPATSEPSAVVEVKPDEVKLDEPAFDPLLARPVAKDAAPTSKPKNVQAPPPSGKWALRFGLCVYKPNCDRMVEELSHKKIEAFITEGEAEVTFYKVMVGPFPTQTHAESAAEKFREKKMELSPFAVDDQHYLGAASFIDPKIQNQMIETAKSLGYRAEGASARESRKVYKVYRSLMFDTKQAAEKALRYHKERGLDCMVERQG